MKYILLLLLFPFLWEHISAQNNPSPDKYLTGLFSTRDGALLAYTNQQKSFMIEFVSGNIEPSENPDALTVDNILIISKITPVLANLMFDSMSIDRQKTALSLFMEKEIVHKFTFDAPVYEWLTINNQLFQFWHMKSNDENSEVEEQMYLTTLCFDQILNLNTPLERTVGNFENNKLLLLKVAKSLKLNNFGINLQALHEELNK